MKSGIVEWRRQILADREREARQRQGVEDAERNRAAQAGRPAIFLEENGTYLSVEWIHHKWFARGRGGATVTDITRVLPTVTRYDQFGNARQCVLAQDLEDAFDRGVAGPSWLGRVEVFEVRNVDSDLTAWEQKALDIVERYGTRQETKQSGMRARFHGARMGGHRSDEAWAWPGEKGVHEVGNLEGILRDHPFEIGFDHHTGSVLWLRSLGKQTRAPREDRASGEEPAPVRQALRPSSGVPEIPLDGGADPDDDTESVEPGPARRFARASAQKHADAKE